MQEIIQCKACGKYIEGEWTLYNGHCNSKDDIGEVTKCTPTETDVGVSCMAGIISKFSKKKIAGRTYSALVGPMHNSHRE